MTTARVLPERQEAILKLVVGEYVSTAAPVGSENVVRRYALSVSPATVRNEMAALEEEGFLTRPHPSAGRVPSDRGYRYYVEFLTDVPELPVEAKLALRRQFTHAERDMDVWTRLAAQLLAQLARNVAIATYPRQPLARLVHLDLALLQESLALLIVVLEQARLRKELLPLKNPVAREELTRVVNKLNTQFSGLTRQEVAAKQVELSPFEEQVLQAAMGIIQEEEQSLSVDYLVEGLRHLLGQPEFSSPEQARVLVQMLEERRVVRAIAAAAPAAGAYRVVIGQENKEEALRPFSVIIAQYGVPGETVGTMGILGPTRMEYARSVAGIRYLASLMDELIQGAWGRSSRG